MMSHILYLSLGSNLGDRLGNLQKAVTFLSPKIQPLIVSSVYESLPWGYSDQPLFLNQVIKTSSDLEPVETLDYIKEIETKIGRVDTFRFGPRVIDLDILFFDNLVLKTPTLTIPHPHIPVRAFVLIPLQEIAPELVHPGLGKTISELVASVDASSIKRFPTDIS